ncbi:bifunctional DNA primase/polymerase [Gordonia sp. NPDC003424]
MNGLIPVESALAYAEAGWFVLPVAPGSKNPGSVVGDDWQHKSTRDTEQIRKWWSRNPDYGIALHPGRSGGVVFDFDKPSFDVLPPAWAEELRQGVWQKSRAGETDRGHYVFANGGVDYSDRAKAWGPYGEIRSKGVIMVAPTPHVKGDGEYTWMGEGVVPQLPDVLAEILRHEPEHAPDNEAPALTEGELKEFLQNPEHDHRRQSGRISGPQNWFRAQVHGGASIHNSIVDVLCWALREVRAGAYSVEDVIGMFQDEFHSAFRSESRSAADRDTPGTGEFYGALAWAAAQVKDEDPEALRQRMDRDKHIDEDVFWSARPELAQLRDFARSRRVGPWSMFGCVLARAVAVIPPSVVFEPLVGGHAGLNIFSAIVAPSGGGKGASEAAAREFLITDPVVYKATSGSGEGLTREYAYKKKSEQVNLRNSVMFSVPEIDTLAALLARSGSTLGGVLRQAWMSEMLGFGYKAEENRYRIEEHRYRMTMVVGVQPGRSRTLFDDADGGTPQRFLWFPVTDLSCPSEHTPDNPGPLKLPRWPGGVLVTDVREHTERDGDQGETVISFDVQELALDTPADVDALHVVRVPQDVVDLVDAERKAKLAGDFGIELDSHATMTRLKIAGALMWLNGRTEAVTDEDWELAGIVMALSNRTRAETLGVLRDRADEANTAKGRAEGKREVAKAEVVGAAELERAVKNVRKHVQNAGRMTRRDGVKKLRPELRDHYDEAVDRLVAAGVIGKAGGSQGSYSVVWKEVE